MSTTIQNISLSGRKKQVSNKEMTFLESLYLVAIVKGLLITIKHFFRKKVTIHYPEQVREMSPVYRGQHMLKRDEQGRENCTACGLCALSCPAEAITMKAAERKSNEKHLYREEKYAEIYEINMLRCIFCGLCEEACPKDAIYLTTSKVLVPSNYERENFIFGKDKLVMPLDIAMQNAQLKNAN
ncbi:NADH-quinone oxidoreductase subunit I [Flavobacterium psychrophilum]|jgi:NADH-quinone oxidoreductase subunit I|uniref:NADH-quinone oxidoreductase subunit I n=2 Tax=Flavobacterium psychrophilum TaxID=96345 RepID=NUOI_FLAPJ|nr:NADH-quinone oxidoreductase subunit I [Flavobacterium psychrophilum]A6H1Q5.1 RecName: Full=NADH-quinone oxidoreductase subunit I; AltName: Full=NADH dehydrogenase I subunit I; AltName: Full=NDH-1 subunit I [Flavobacterium psychrophilum JIP02/86]AIG30950.1 NADH-quinone oxidoreductase subunit I [Flavobacterium psychrophilum]AIG33227.1 NADH-quinone oxidoreductase subunit I [Flavobacterium psychrophilum]AIG35376.1 NADH-quinone oxidoreductase subunit I [Flavobacterium psychrophilum]AIG37736.1 NA